MRDSSMLPPSPRRSRRHGSNSTSKSPDVPDERSDRPSRSRKPKLEEDVDDSIPLPPAPSRARKRRADVDDDDVGMHPDVADDVLPDEEDQGVTRCICDDEADAGEFMIQCETCSVWQHGVCMAFTSEEEVPDEYFCEQCRPDLHQATIELWQNKKREKAERAARQASHHAQSRVSRSHSPNVTMKQPSKRRNTMNSRDADFDEITKQILEVSAAEAAAALDGGISLLNGLNGHHTPSTAIVEDDIEPGPMSARGGKKRRRTDDDALPSGKKRTRSASTTSEHPLGSAVTRGETPAIPGASRKPSVPVLGPPPKPTAKNKRGSNRKSAPNVDMAAGVENDDSTQPPLPPSKRGNQILNRGRGGNKRPPLSHATPSTDTVRRNQGISGTNGQTSESSRAYKNSHAYVVSQQPLYTSWNLPDYLAHLEEILPSETPHPLEVRSAGRGESVERTTERGVRVKWPGKRMSVVDMNKRVRALVEWVGREQASALERDRRRAALERALREDIAGRMTVDVEDGGPNLDAPNGVESFDSPALEKSLNDVNGVSTSQSTGTMKLMEELMEELIKFQEKFGPGTRNR